MLMRCQQPAINDLQEFADADRHSIIIDGPKGCGKTYLAKQFADMKGISDFIVINPVVADIRNSIESVYRIQNKVVVCIENLDQGVISASYTMLKFLEEPLSRVYIVVTCSQYTKIPDTIHSRSVHTIVSAPTKQDIDTFAKQDSIRYQEVSKFDLFNSIRSFSDVTRLFNMKDANIKYFDSVLSTISKKDCISTIYWNLSHFEDDSKIPVDLLLGYLIYKFSQSLSTMKYARLAIQCLKDLTDIRIPEHVVMQKFLLEYKYGE